MKKYLGLAGIFAGIVLVAFGIGAIAIGVDGRNTVRDSLAAEKIVGGDDMSPAEIKKGIEEAGLTGVEMDIPTVDVIGQPIDTGEEARAFAGYMRIHALEGSDGLTYAEMGRFATADGNPAGTNDSEAALKDDTGKPVSNSARNTWVTATALTTALNVSFMAEQIALFGIVVGVALLLSGVGFMILAYVALGAPLLARKQAPTTSTPAPVV